MIKKIALAAITAAATWMSTAPANATAIPTCLTDGSAPLAIDCRGYVSGQLIDGNAPDIATQQAYLNQMGFTGTISASLFSDSNFTLSNLMGATSLSFAGAPELFGDTFIGIHWGGQGGGQSAIYEFDFTSPVSSIAILSQNPGGSSGAVLYGTQPTSAVPEPATWAMMIGGFLMVGAAMRRKSVVALRHA